MGGCYDATRSSSNLIKGSINIWFIPKVRRVVLTPGVVCVPSTTIMPGSNPPAASPPPTMMPPEGHPTTARGHATAASRRPSASRKRYVARRHIPGWHTALCLELGDLSGALVFRQVGHPSPTKLTYLNPKFGHQGSHFFLGHFHCFDRRNLLGAHAFLDLVIDRLDFRLGGCIRTTHALDGLPERQQGFGLLRSDSQIGVFQLQNTNGQSRREWCVRIDTSRGLSAGCLSGRSAAVQNCRRIPAKPSQSELRGTSFSFSSYILYF